MGIIKTIIEKRKRTGNTIEFWRDKGAKIGRNCSIHPSANLSSGPYLIEIGDHVRINTGVIIVTHDGGVWTLRGLDESLNDADLFGCVKIGNNVHIGSNSIICPNVTIGNNCIIGVNAVVTKNIPDNTVVAGIPARIIESIEEYRLKHQNDFVFTKHMSADEKQDFLLNNWRQNNART